jgi:hypothetical protein
VSLFRRRRPDPGPWDLAAEAAAAFGRAGLPVSVAPEGDLVTADGRRFGLHNLRLVLESTPRARWRAVVDRHARTMAAAVRADDPASLEEVADILLPRVVDAGVAGGTLPARALAAGRPLAPGLCVLPALDRPETVATLTAVEALGGWDAIWPVATANLRRLPLPEHLVVDTETVPSARVHVFRSEDFFGASRVLDLDHLLAATLRLERPAQGTLVVLPNRHVLAAHVVESAAVLRAVPALLAFAEAQADGPGPLSPHVYHRSADGRLEQVSSRDADGAVHVDATGSLGQALAALGLTGDDA